MAFLISYSQFPAPLYIFIMRTLLRTALYLALIVWLGAEIFFPVVAAVTFRVLHPDTHTAGAIVGYLLRILHGMGLASGLVALAVMALAPVWGVYKRNAVLLPMALLAVMLGLTVYSQIGIIPAMERDRIAAGGAIDAVESANPSRVDFERLHKGSVWVEEAVLLLGLATVALVARAESVS
jgi:hypothetical protein